MRPLGISLLAAAAVAAAFGAGAARSAVAPTTLRIPVAKAGNVTVARVTLTPRGVVAVPKLTVSNARALGREIAVLASTEPQTRRARRAAGPAVKKPVKRKVNIIVVHRHRGRSRGLASYDLAGALRALPSFVVVRVPAGFASTRPLLATNVVQDNPPPPFDCTPSAPVNGLYVGASLRRTSLRGLGSSACLLALDRPAPVGVTSLLGADYCSLATAPAGGAGLELTIAVTCSFGGLNFLELEFGNGLTVLGELPFSGAQCRARGGVQDCAFPAGVAKGTSYRERILFDRKPPPGRELVLRGSADGGKTFPYRFAGRFPARATPGG